jgi:hypothetical protein
MLKAETKEVTLKSGTKVVVKELSALEEVLAYQLVDKKSSEADSIGSIVLHTYVTVALSIASIDGEALKPLTTIDDVYQVLGMFGKREWNALVEEVNKLGEEDLAGE